MDCSNPASYWFLAAGVSGALAYTVGLEHSEYSYGDGPVQPATLRVTHIYRRENGDTLFDPDVVIHFRHAAQREAGRWDWYPMSF